MNATTDSDGPYEQEQSRFEWERVERIVVYDSPRRARYPSIARTGDGTILVLLSQQTARQEGSYGEVAGLVATFAQHL